MEFLSQIQSLKEYGPGNALTQNEVNNIFRLAKPTKNDVFYDLGSGYGDLVRSFYTKTNVKRAVGLEVDYKRFLISVELTRDEFDRKLKNIDFRCTEFQYYNFSDATIVYSGIDEVSNDKQADNVHLDIFNSLFSNNKIKIIKRDLPLIGYGYLDKIRDPNGSSFFLMQTPLKNHKIQNKTKWIEQVLGKKGKTTNDLVKYFINQYKKRGTSFSREKISELKKDFERIASSRFVT